MFHKKKNEDLDVLARRSTDKAGEVEAKISQGIRMKGEIEGKDNVNLEGSFEGKAKVNGLFLISKSGNFNGELNAESVIIEGGFEGTINSSKKIELRSEAKVKGSISSNVIAIAEGSFFEGEIKMTNNGSSKQVTFEEKRKIKT